MTRWEVVTNGVCLLAQVLCFGVLAYCGLALGSTMVLGAILLQAYLIRVRWMLARQHRQLLAVVEEAQRRLRA